MPINDEQLLLISAAIAIALITPVVVLFVMFARWSKRDQEVGRRFRELHSDGKTPPEE